MTQEQDRALVERIAELSRNYPEMIEPELIDYWRNRGLEAEQRVKDLEALLGGLKESVDDLYTWVDRTGSKGKTELLIPRVPGEAIAHGFISLDRVIDQIRPALKEAKALLGEEG